MALNYGFVKCKLATAPSQKSKPSSSETQYHVHATLAVANDDGGATNWDTAINVGTDDADDLLRYKLVYDFHHPIRTKLAAAAGGFSDLTGVGEPPALDFLRGDILADTGPWRDSDVLDGSEEVEPVKSLLRLLRKAHAGELDVYIFGRTYTHGGKGIHDVHMNQGSSGKHFRNNGNDHNDHNDVWQDAAVIVDLGSGKWAAYFTAFTQQTVPTDELGNPTEGSHAIDTVDEDSLAGH